MRKLALIVLLLIAFVSGKKLLSIGMEYKEANDYYKALQSLYTISSTPVIKEEICAHTTTQKAPIEIDFNKLKEVNKDVVGWIYSEDTPINYPVLQTTSNIKYLRQLIDGRYSASGSIFLDSICAPNFSDDNSIIYGHHMRDGSMFASLNKYKRQNYYDEHSQLWLLTPEEDYLIVPFAGLVVNSDSFFFTNTIEDKQDYIGRALKQSTFIPTEIPNVKDRLITLSTCDYTHDDARFILIGILVPNS